MIISLWGAFCPGAFVQGAFVRGAFVLFPYNIYKSISCISYIISLKSKRRIQGLASLLIYLHVSEIHQRKLIFCTLIVVTVNKFIDRHLQGS